MRLINLRLAGGGGVQDRLREQIPNVIDLVGLAAIEAVE